MPLYLQGHKIAFNFLPWRSQPIARYLYHLTGIPPVPFDYCLFYALCTFNSSLYILSTKLQRVAFSKNFPPYVILFLLWVFITWNSHPHTKILGTSLFLCASLFFLRWGLTSMLFLIFIWVHYLAFKPIIQLLLLVHF